MRALVFMLLLLAILILFFVGFVWALSVNYKTDDTKKKDTRDNSVDVRKTPWWVDLDDSEVIHSEYGKLRVFRNRNIHDGWGKDASVTLLLVLTIDNLSFLKEVPLRWNGPIAVVLYLQESIADYQLSTLKENILSRFDPVDNFLNCRVHVVVGQDEIFPFTYLVNMAWDMVNTKYVMIWKSTTLPGPSSFELLDTFFKDKSSTNHIYTIAEFGTDCDYKGIDLFDYRDEDFIDMDDFDYFFDSYQLSQPNYFFATLRRFQFLLSHCIAKIPLFVDSPINYLTWYHEALESNHEVIPNDNTNIYWGYAPNFVCSKEIPRPQNGFLSPTDALSHYLFSIYFESNINFESFTLPYPIYGFRVTSEYSSNIEENIDERMICSYKEDILSSLYILEDFWCNERTEKYKGNRLACCGYPPKLQKTQRSKDIHLRPNWEKLLRPLSIL